MIRKLYVVIFYLFIAASASAQPYNNEWIAFSGIQIQSTQQYYRIAVWKDGIYRITYQDLQAAGVDTNTWFQPSQFQLFHQGVEQYIEVADFGQQGIFRTGDYIEFYGKKNRGELDAFLYDTSWNNINPYYSLFNDTSVYFLTYNPTAPSTRRMVVENDQNFPAYPLAPYRIYEEVKEYHNAYSISIRDGEGVADNSYTAGEGFALDHNSCNKNTPFNQTFQITDIAGSDVNVEVSVAGANLDAHSMRIYVNGVEMLYDFFVSYDYRKYNFNATGITNGTMTVTVAPQNDGNPYANYVHVGYIKIRYNKGFNLQGSGQQQFSLPASSSKQVVEFSNTGLTSPLLYILSDTVKKVQLDNASTLRGIVPSLSVNTECFLTDASAIYNATGNTVISPAGVNGYFTNYSLLAQNKNFVIVSHKKLWNTAQQYASYRDSTGFPTVLADIDELYDQYAWGIRKHPLAIRNYCDNLIDNINPKPEYLLLLGKGVMSHNARFAGYDINLIPTYGEPASDMMFTSRLNTPEFIPDLATGRIAAQNDSDVTIYLNKLRMYESNQQLMPSPSWMKRVLHFGGGINANEQAEISGKLNGYKQIIEDTLFGGEVITFLKSSTDPIQINQSQYLKSLIDDGCSMMTFYGHAAGSGFDISTDAPENYTNFGKYPVVLAQSCYVGDIHSTSKLLNERFVIAKDKAAIAFLAVADKAYVWDLDQYSTRLHQELFRNRYGSSVAKCMQSTIDSTMISANLKSICMNMTLHGDPALRINGSSKTELKVSNSEILFSPEAVTTQSEFFDVKVVITNLGKTTSAPFPLKLSRIFPDGTSSDSIMIVTAQHFRDTITITLPVDFQKGSGLNQFNVVIDEDNLIDEYDDIVNNRAGTQLIINSTDINPVYPQPFAIVPSDAITLKAVTANLFASPRNYRFEVDTNDHFTAPIHSGSVVNAKGIVAYTIPFALDSNLVYFWRVANDSITIPDTAISSRFQWKTSSFIYKPGITGWSQAHFHQFRNDQFTNIIYNDGTVREFVYVNDSNSIQALNFFAPVVGNGDPGVSVNNALIESGGCGGAGNAFALIVLDSLDNSLAWNNANNPLGQYNTYRETVDSNGLVTVNFTCRPRIERYFLFPYANPAYLDSLVAALTDSIPCGNYIVLWSGKLGVNSHFDYSSVHTTLLNTLASMGAPAATTLQDSSIFIFFTRKCDPASTVFVIGNSANPNIAINTQIGGRWNKGFITSSTIGPALQWNSLHWNYHSLEAGPTEDSISIRLSGINTAGDESVIIDSIAPPQFDISNLQTINATTYPYLRLRAYKEDGSSNPSPPHLDKWQVYYEPVPEGSLNPSYYSLISDTVDEGSDVTFSMAFENISTIEMDTLLVDFFLYDDDNVRHAIATKRLHRKLPPGDTIMASVTFNTLGFGGNNTLWIEVNPRNDQPEQHHFNNIASVKLNVNRDITNPLLDVTFDGIHILSGDIVSAKPSISIQVLDENKYIALNDTSNFRVQLKSPSGAMSILTFENNPGVSTDRNLLKWTPASLPKNSFKIEYNPVLPEDGIYELHVQASDESGNLSGSHDYRIQFEIINRSTITHVINYPNPFSTATKFVFVLTGSEIPNDFNIQIMTVTGRVVRTITRQELGNIRIGRNITDYAWDGHDEFGDRLANGVYLYRVVSRINGETIEQRETSADQYFKKGWGKMYLMR